MRLKIESGSTISGRATKGWKSGDRRRGKMRKICFANFSHTRAWLGRRRSRAWRVSMPRWIYGLGGRGVGWYRFLFSPFRPTTYNFFSADIAMLVNYFVYPNPFSMPPWNSRCIRRFYEIPLKRTLESFGHSARPRLLFALFAKVKRYWFINAHLWIDDVCDQCLPI